MKNSFNYTLEKVPQLAEKILVEYAEQSVFIFEGDLGAGKTTLIKSLCQQLGVETTVSSPTYNLVNEYEAKKQLVYHMDLYRLKDEAELFDIGIESYLSSSNTIIFVEWGDLLIPFLEQYVLVKLTTEEPKSRSCFVKLIKV